jgi:TIR domain
MARIFISHSSANNAEAIAVRDWMKTQGWDDVFLDLDPKRGLVAGDRWQAALKAAVDHCELVIFIVSPEWAASRWCQAEFLLTKHGSNPKAILPVIVSPTPFSTLRPR